MGTTRLALRHVRRSPIPFVLCALTIAGGAGATTALLTTLRGVLAPPAISNIHEVVNIYHHRSGPMVAMALSWPDFQDLQELQHSFAVVAGWTRFADVLNGNGISRAITGEAVSEHYFSLVREPPLLGRPLVAADHAVGVPPVMVLGFERWVKQFGSDPDVVNRQVALNGHLFTVVGVMPRQFRGVDMAGLHATDAWIPLSSVGALTNASWMTLDPADRSHRWLMVKARLLPGKSVQDAAADVVSVGRALDESEPLPDSNGPLANRDWSTVPATAVRVHESVSKEVLPTVTLIVGVLIAAWVGVCTNLANVTLAAGTSRAHEFSVRCALGATRRQLLGDQTAESALVAIVGGAGAIPVAYWLLAYLRDRIEFTVGAGFRIEIDPTFTLVTCLYVVLLAALATGIFGLWPAYASSRVHPANLLTTGHPSGGGRQRLRRNLIALQVLATVLLTAVAFLFADQIRRRADRDTGADLDRLAVAELNLQTVSPGAVERVLTDLLRAVRSEPSVEDAALVTDLPMRMTAPIGEIRVSGNDSPIAVVGISPTAIAVLGGRVLFGRPFLTLDARTHPTPVLISESSALRLFGRSNAVGSLIQLRLPALPGREEFGFADATIVGVTSSMDVRAVGRRDLALAFVPMVSADLHLTLVARTSRRPTDTGLGMQQAVRTAGRGATIIYSGPARDLVDPNNLDRVVAEVTATAGVTLIILTMIGIGGLQAHAVIARTSEIGVRLALGSTPRRIVQALVRDALSPVWEGLVMGLAILALAGFTLKYVILTLFSDASLWSLAWVPLIILVSSAAAAVGPARRASRLMPMDALRRV